MNANLRNCFNYAGCKGRIFYGKNAGKKRTALTMRDVKDTIYRPLVLLFLNCFNYAGCKEVTRILYARLGKRTALTMRDVKVYKKIKVSISIDELL